MRPCDGETPMTYRVFSKGAICWSVIERAQALRRRGHIL